MLDPISQIARNQSDMFFVHVHRMSAIAPRTRPGCIPSSLVGTVPLPEWSMPDLSDEPTDQELVIAIAGGDRDALGTLYARYAGSMMALAGSFRLGDRAHDLVHDVFMEVWAKAHEYESSKATVQTWLMMRARSRCLDRVRKASRRTKILQRSGDDVARPTEAVSPGRQSDHGRVRECVDALAEDLREVVVLAYFEGSTTSEIAERLEIPQGTVKSRMRRGREALRDALGGGES